MKKGSGWFFVVCALCVAFNVGVLSVVDSLNEMLMLFTFDIIFICFVILIILMKIRQKKQKLNYLSVIHDLKTPIYSICHLTKKEKLNKEETGQINFAANSLIDIINSELNSSKNESKSFNIALVINEIIDIVRVLAEKKNICLEVLNNHLVNENLYGNDTKLKQILINLLVNSIKYTKENGKVILVVNEIIKNKKRYFSFDVIDNGIGMSKDFVKTIFKPYKRCESDYVRTNDGYGIGLYNVKKIVDFMKGKIEVISFVNKGSRFKVVLPFKVNKVNQKIENKKVIYYDNDIIDYHFNYKVIKEMCSDVIYCKKLNELEELAPEYDIVINNSSKTLNLENICSNIKVINTKGVVFKTTMIKELLDKEYFLGQRVLLADDNEINLQITKEIIEKSGILVEIAKNGQELYDKFVKSPSNYYNLILTDIHMPIMSGYNVSRKIRDLRRADAKKIPIIAVSATSYQDEIKNVKKFKMNGFLDKPIHITELFAVLQQFIKTDCI